jgi:TPR repeat protein
VGVRAQKAERQRTEFNVHLQTLKQTGASAKIVDGAVKSMQDLAHQRFPPAMYMVGLWETTGDHVAKNPAEGLALIQKAAAKNYGPALYEISIRQIEGRDLPQDIEKGLDAMRHASVLGSAQAQFYLGHRYETGSGVPRDLDRARRHFRLCAAQGIALCQYRLGLLMLDGSEGPARDPVQAVAWLQLAADQGVSEAGDLLSTEAPKLTAEQTAWVTTLKPQLLRK